MINYYNADSISLQYLKWKLRFSDVGRNNSWDGAKKLLGQVEPIWVEMGRKDHWSKRPETQPKEGKIVHGNDGHAWPCIATRRKVDSTKKYKSKKQFIHNTHQYNTQNLHGRISHEKHR